MSTMYLIWVILSDRCFLQTCLFGILSAPWLSASIYICGTDEYGTATETKALEEGVSCQALCDKYYAIHRDVYEWFNLSHSITLAAPPPRSKPKIVQDMFHKCNNNGYMFQQSVTQLFCEKCERFLADRYVEGNLSQDAVMMTRAVTNAISAAVFSTPLILLTHAASWMITALLCAILPICSWILRSFNLPAKSLSKSLLSKESGRQ